jgi:amidase
LAAIGTETNGSIVCPAGANGVVGIKPTVGLVSRTGIVPISHSQDTAGPMARTVADAVTVLSAMIGTDEQDPATEVAAAAAWTLGDHLRKDGLRGKRIGVLRSLAGFHSEVDRLLDAAVADLGAAGAVVVDDLAVDLPESFDEAAYDVLLYEFKHDLDAYLAGLPHRDRLPARTLEQIIAFNRAHASAEMPFFGQDVFEKAQAKGALDEEVYRQALDLVRRATREEGIDRIVAEHDLDALVAPTGSPAWKIDLINGDHFMGGSSTLAACAGYPNISVPMGSVHGLPVGLSFFGPKLSEPVLVEIAFAYEQATRRRAPPRLVTPPN